MPPFFISLPRGRERAARRRAELLARQSEARTAALLESALDCVITMDHAGRIVEFNPAAEQTFRYRRADVVGKELAEVIVPAALREQHRRGLARFLAGGEAAVLNRRIEITAVRSTGEEFPVELTVVAVPVADGPPAFTGFVRDITERRQVETRLREAESQYRTLVEQIPAAIHTEHCGESGATIYISEQITAMLGYPPADWQADATFWEARLHPADRERVLAERRRSRATGAPFQMEYRLLARDGRPVWLRDESVLVWDDSDQPRYWQGIKLDITEQKHAEEAVRLGDERFSALVRHAWDMISVLDADGVRRYVSPACERILGYAPAELLGQHAAEIDHPDDVPLTHRFYADLARRPGATASFDVRVRHRDGSVRWLEVIATNCLADPSVGGIICHSRDVTERKEFEKQLAHQAFYDSLTGLPNRVLFHDRLGHALARRDRHQRMMAVLFLDLDDFKVINDSLGHSCGDQLLQEVARRLQGCVQADDTVARLGGDEFTILLEDLRDGREATEVAGRIGRAMEPYCLLDGHEVVVSASIGIALHTDHAGSAGDLQRDADAAMYAAKRGGKARYALFDQSMSQRARERLELEAELRQALKADELRVYYQPIVELATGRISGVEALARWQHPTRGLLAPDTFIPLAEETGLILPLGQWVLAAACRQVRAWQALRPSTPPLVVSVNLSARQFQEPGLVAGITRILTETALDPRCLQLEITERVALEDVAATAALIAELRRLGVQLAIDDFGTGYSGLGALKRCRVDTIKLDRSFVAGLDQQAEDTAIVHAALAFGQALGVSVTAEGVETEAQLQTLRELGCDQAQGYFFAKPLPARVLGALLVTSPTWLDAVAARAAEPIPTLIGANPLSGDANGRANGHGTGPRREHVGRRAG